MKISVNIPTHNEEDNIKKVINNVKKIADEIILIDNSNDDTIEIAKKEFNKIKVINCKYKDFSKIRNKGLNNVKKGWFILYIDSDELLSEKLIKRIKAIKKIKKPADVYLIKRKHFFKYDNSIACLTTRFIKGEPKLAIKGSIKFINKIHEKAVFNKKNLKIKELKEYTLHYPEVSKYNKNSDYTKMYIKELFKDKKINNFIKTNIKQLIKYLLIFDYHPKYWIGNFKFWINTVKHSINIINGYLRLKND